MLPSALCHQLKRYSMVRIHPSKRCYAQRLIYNNIFHMETSALAIRRVPPVRLGVLLTDFACAHPSVDHIWRKSSRIISLLSSMLARSGSPSTWDGGFVKDVGQVAFCSPWLLPLYFGGCVTLSLSKTCHLRVLPLLGLCIRRRFRHHVHFV